MLFTEAMLKRLTEGNRGQIKGTEGSEVQPSREVIEQRRVKW